MRCHTFPAASAAARGICSGVPSAPDKSSPGAALRTEVDELSAVLESVWP